MIKRFIAGLFLSLLGLFLCGGYVCVILVNWNQMGRYLLLGVWDFVGFLGGILFFILAYQVFRHKD